jgi:hypothetical protein
MVELKGSLNGIGLPAIVQLIGELHHSGSLELVKGPATGMLGFDDGRLVIASFEQEHGLTALAACVSSLRGGDFRFIEGIAAGERSLDLSPGEVQRLVARVSNGESIDDYVEPPAVAVDDNLDQVCPRLGFADDPARHYSRPTALHRCYASDAPSLVTSQEQRELCLGGRFPTCPRFRNATKPIVPAPMPVANTPPAPPLIVPAPEPDPSTAVTQPSPVPAGVASRIAALSNMRRSGPAPDEPATAWDGNQVSEPAPVPTRDDVAVVEPVRALPRSLLLMIGGGLLGLVVLVLAIAFAVPAFNSGLVQTPSNPTATQALEAVPTVFRSPATSTVAVAAARATTAPTLAPTPTSGGLAASTPAARPATPTAAPSAGLQLIDVRFATGPSADWQNNPPFAAWSDGAYRLQARQAAHFVAVSAPIESWLSDVVVSATFRKTGGPPGGGYGLVIRDQGSDPRNGVNQNFDAYVLETGDVGEFGVWRRNGDHWVDLVPWTRSSAVRAGGSPNDLTVRASSDRLAFLVNGVEVTTIQDKTLDAGTVGVFVGGDYNEVALDRFSVQVPN